MVPVVRPASQKPALKSLNISERAIQGTKFALFWAMRPARGATIGATFMDHFRKDVKKMVQIGNEYKGKPMSSDQMQEWLRVLYPSRFDIPISHHTSQFKTVVGRR